ncbi:bifunctional DNA-directed RNA polymerase Rpb11 [Babesia duncani]|uniref:Bifunctional DNA-directed RNA polymerase Rpb11 n=1 Tax=Babesia duncani TaxID=323732 RepID=A0AAD9PPM4_9APIC|nr:bifunctional DNA-directed RNA polymerase Rpb11 [Babesia duncani]
MDNIDPKSPNVTFCIENEDHTIGNVLRTMLVERDDVVFAGYSVPHPMQPEVNIRLQTTGKPALKIFQECLDELIDICDILANAFENAPTQKTSNYCPVTLMYHKIFNFKARGPIMQISTGSNSEIIKVPFEPVELDDVKELTLFEYFLQLSFHTCDLHVTRALSLCPKDGETAFTYNAMETFKGSVVSFWMDLNRMVPPQSYEDCLSQKMMNIDFTRQLYETGSIAPPLGFQGNPTGQFRMMLFRVALGRCLVHSEDQDSYLKRKIPQNYDSLELNVNSEPRFYNSLYRIASNNQVLPYAIVEFEFRPVKIDVPEPICEICETVPAQWYCPCDKAHFCNSCDMKHHSSTPIFSRHARIASSKSPMQFGICEYHPSEIVDMVCMECCVVLCSHCIMFGNHSDPQFLNHPLVSTLDAYEHSLKNPFEHDELMVARLNKVTQRIRDRHALLKQIYGNFNHAKTKVNNARELFVKDLEMMKQQKLQYLNAITREIDVELAQMKWLESFLNHLLLCLGHADFVAVKKRFDLAIEKMFGGPLSITTSQMPSWVLQDLRITGDTRIQTKSLELERLQEQPVDDDNLEYKCWEPVALYDDWNETLGYCPDGNLDMDDKLKSILNYKPMLLQDNDEYEDQNDTTTSSNAYLEPPLVAPIPKSTDPKHIMARSKVTKLWDLLSEEHMATLLCFTKIIKAPERSDLVHHLCVLASYHQEMELLFKTALKYEMKSITQECGYCILMRTSTCIPDLTGFLLGHGASKDMSKWIESILMGSVSDLVQLQGDAQERAMECLVEIIQGFVEIVDAIALPSTLRFILYQLTDAVPSKIAPILCVDFLASALATCVLKQIDYTKFTVPSTHVKAFSTHLSFLFSRIGIVAWEINFPLLQDSCEIQLATKIHKWISTLLKRPRLVSNIHTFTPSLVPQALESANWIMNALAKIEQAHNMGTLDVPSQVANALTSQYNFLELFKMVHPE